MTNMCIFGRMINKIVEIGKVVEIKLRGDCLKIQKSKV